MKRLLKTLMLVAALVTLISNASAHTTDMAAFDEARAELDKSFVRLDLMFKDLDRTYTEAQMVTAGVTATALGGAAATTLMLLKGGSAGSTMTVTGPGLALTTSFGAGFFFGKMIVHGDELYLDGYIVDRFSRKVIEPSFNAAYKIKNVVTQMMK